MAAHGFGTRIRRVILWHGLELLELLKHRIAQYFGGHALGSMLGEGRITTPRIPKSVATWSGFYLILFLFGLQVPLLFPYYHVVYFLVTCSRCINGIFIDLYMMIRKSDARD